jgi:hypothetical protein
VPPRNCAQNFAALALCGQKTKPERSIAAMSANVERDMSSLPCEMLLFFGCSQCSSGSRAGVVQRAPTNADVTRMHLQGSFVEAAAENRSFFAANGARLDGGQRVTLVFAASAARGLRRAETMRQAAAPLAKVHCIGFSKGPQGRPGSGQPLFSFH